MKVFTPSSTRSSARRAWFSASATCPLRSARFDAYQDAPARSRSDPRAVASSRIAGDRLPRLVVAIGHDERPHAQVVGRAPAGLVQQQVALERLGAPAPRTSAASGVPSSTPIQARCARNTRSSSGSVVAGRSIAGAPHALVVALGDHHQRVERRRLDRQPCVGIALAGQLALEELGVIGVAGAERR